MEERKGISPADGEGAYKKYWLDKFGLNEEEFEQIKKDIRKRNLEKMERIIENLIETKVLDSANLPKSILDIQQIGREVRNQE